MNELMRQAVLVCGVLCVLLVPLLLYDRCAEIIGDGFSHVAVTVRSSSGAPIRAVACMPCANGEEAPRYVQQLKRQDKGKWDVLGWGAKADPFVGEAFDVTVPFSVRTSGLGVTRSFHQFRRLVVVAEYHDGTRHEAAVAIDGPPIPSVMTVELP